MYKVFFKDRTVFFTVNSHELKKNDHALVHQYDSRKALGEIIDEFFQFDQVKELLPRIGDYFAVEENSRISFLKEHVHSEVLADERVHVVVKGMKRMSADIEYYVVHLERST